MFSSLHTDCILPLLDRQKKKRTLGGVVIGFCSGALCLLVVFASAIRSHWSLFGLSKRDPPEKFGQCKWGPPVTEISSQWCSPEAASCYMRTQVGGVWVDPVWIILLKVVGPVCTVQWVQVALSKTVGRLSRSVSKTQEPRLARSRVCLNCSSAIRCSLLLSEAS